jgi:hypothetical protein
MKRHAEKLIVLLTLAAVVCWVPAAGASITLDAGNPTAKVMVSGTGSGGASLAAEADFYLNGGSLYIFLKNTSDEAVNAQANTLAALLWSSETTLSTTGGQANLTYPGGLPSPPFPVASVSAFVVNGLFPTGGNVNDMWGYASGLSGAPHGANQGISEAGFGLFGQANFPGGSSNLDGSSWGIVSASTPDTTNLDGLGGRSYPRYFTYFVLTSAGSSLTLDNISFQYGTGLNEPNLVVPIPPTVWLLGSGLLGLIGFRRKFEKN